MNICSINMLFLVIIISFFYIFQKKRLKTIANVNCENPDFSNNLFFFIFVILILTIVATFRTPFGLSQDYTTYQEIFENSYLPLNDLFKMYPQNDLGFLLIGKFIFFFVENHFVFFGILAFLNLYCFGILFRRHSSIVWLSFLLLITIGSYYVSFNAIRQFIVVDIFILSSHFIMNRNLKKFIIIILFSTMIHKSAIFLLPVYFILNFNFIEKMSLKNKVISIILFLFIILNFDLIYNFLSKFIYGNYTVGSFGMNGASITMVIRPILVFVFLLIFRKNIDFTNKFDFLAFNSTIIWLALSLASLSMFNLSRFTYYFIPFSLCLIPNCIFKEQSSKKRTLAMFCTVLVVLLYGFATQYNSLDTLVFFE